MDVNSFVAAVRILDEVTAQTKAVAQQYGIDTAAVRRAKSWVALFNLFLDAGRARARADAATEINALKAELRELGVEPEQCDADGVVDDRRTDPGMVVKTSPSSTPLPDPVEAPSAGATLVAPLHIQRIEEAAATVIAVDVLGFIVADIMPPERSGCWLGPIEHLFVQGRQRALCETAALAVKRVRAVPETMKESASESFELYLQRFTEQIIGLRRSSWIAVAEAIIERRWHRAEKPCAYVNSAATNILFLQERHGLGARSRDVFARLGGDAPRSLDLPPPGRELTDDPLVALIPGSDGDASLGAVDFAADVGMAFSKLGLDPDEIADFIELVEARYGGVTRTRLPAALGWSPRKVAAVEKALQRLRPRLKAALAN
jgi:hypothetical protein